MLQIASIRMKEAIQSTIPDQDMRKDSSFDHADTINPMNESQGPNFFVMAGKRLKKLGFRFSTERDSNLIHFTKEVFKPDVSHNVRGSLKVSYRLESPSFNEVKQQKEILNQKKFLEALLNDDLQISDESYGKPLL